MRTGALHIIAATLTATLVLARATPGPAQQPVVLKLGNVQEVGQVVQVGLKRFADLVAERTKNQVQVQVFPASQLGTEQELLEGVQLNTVHMFEGATGAVGRFLPELEALAAPYIWRDMEHMRKTVRGPIGMSLAERLAKSKGMRLLDMNWIMGYRHLSTKSKPVRTPEDLKGTKVRALPVPIYLQTIKAMGGNPTPLDWKEVYLGLQSGVIDGQETSITPFFNARLFEVQKYMMLTEHIMQNQAIVINEKIYQGLSPAFRTIIQEAAVEAGDYQNDLSLKQEQADLEQLKAKGMVVVQPDLTAFRAATKDVWKMFADKWEPRLYERIQEVR